MRQTFYSVVCRVLCAGLAVCFASALFQTSAFADSGDTDDVSDAGPSIDPAIREYAQSLEGVRTWGLYFGDKRIGWVTETAVILSEDGREVLTRVYEVRRDFFIENERHTIESTRTLRHQLAGDGDLVYLAEVEQSQAAAELDSYAIEISRTDHDLAVEVVFNGEQSHFAVPFSREDLAQGARFQRWLTGDRKRGDRIEFFDFQMLGALEGERDLNVEMECVFDEQREVDFYGENRSVFAVSCTDAKGVESHCELFENGTEFACRLAGASYRREWKPPTEDIEPPQIDEIRFVESDRPIRERKSIVELTLQVVGDREIDVPVSRRQSMVERNEKGPVLLLRRGFRGKAGDPLTVKERELNTRATVLLQSDRGEIADLARKIVGDETQPLARIDKLQSWVYWNISGDSQTNSSSALTVLETRSGDCTENTALFIALARSLGIPAREVGGFMYADSKGSWAGHAWAEAHDGYEWVTVDPSFDQVRVDATHILVTRGPWQNHLQTQFLGARIEVLAVEYDSFGAWLFAQDGWVQIVLVFAAWFAMFLVMAAVTLAMSALLSRSPARIVSRLAARARFLVDSIGRPERPPAVLYELYLFVCLAALPPFLVRERAYTWDIELIEYVPLAVLFLMPLFAAVVTAILTPSRRTRGLKGAFLRYFTVYLWIGTGVVFTLGSIYMISLT